MSRGGIQRARTRVLAPVGIACTIASCMTLAHHAWRKQASFRERSFIAIHFLVGDAARQGPLPSDLDTLVDEFSNGAARAILRRFPNGLDYRPAGDRFTLAEPAARRVSLFRSDRLVGSGESWPHWEKSGKPARK